VRLLKTDLELVVQISARLTKALSTGKAAAIESLSTENGAENIFKPVITAKVAAIKSKPLISASLTLASHISSEFVVLGPFGLVLKHLIGFADGLKLCLSISLIAHIWMIFTRKLFEGALDFLLGRRWLNAQNFVIVSKIHNSAFLFE